MDGHLDRSTAEIADHHSRLIALVMLVMSLYFAASAASFFVSDEVARYLDMLEVGAAIFVVGVMLPVMFWKILKLPREDRPLYFSSDGYVAQTLLQAKNASWVTTFMVLIVVDQITEERFAEVPPRFFIQVILAIMLGVFGGVFFLLNRSADE